MLNKIEIVGERMGQNNYITMHNLFDKLALVCQKTQNRVKICALLEQYSAPEAIHIIAQMAWDKSNGAGMSEIYGKLKSGGYLWNWYQIEPEMDDSVETQPGAMTCGKCGSNRIKMRSQQTRSGDEGQTVFALCSMCGNKWSTN